MELYFKQKLTGQKITFCLNADRYHYGAEPPKLNFVDVLNQFDELSQKSNVSVNNKNMIDENIRKSKILENINIDLDSDKHNYYYFNQEEEKFNNLIKTILPKNLRLATYKLPFGHNNKWDMLVYNEGDFFVRHTDGKANDEHFATLLLLPPKKIKFYPIKDSKIIIESFKISTLSPKEQVKSSAKMEDLTDQDNLVLYDGSKKIIISADDNEWSLIGFPINVEHECLQITFGRRVVFKTKFEIPKKIYEFYSNPKFTLSQNELQIEESPESPMDKLIKIGTELKNLKIAKKELKEKINMAKKNKKEIERSINTYQYDNLVKTITACHSKVIFVVLERKYNSVDPNYLIGEDRRLFMELNAQIPNKIIKLVNKSIEQNMKDDKSDENSKMEKYSRYDFPEIHIGSIHHHGDNIFATFFQNDSSNDVPGELVNRLLVYNDQGYDTVYHFVVTAIAIIKL
jgi:hypothetical protein